MSTQEITNFHRIPSWTDASADPVQSTVYNQSEILNPNCISILHRNLDATQGGFLYLKKLRHFSV